MKSSIAQQAFRLYYVFERALCMLPDFLIIGAMKCGTTSLYYYLKAHPGIAMSEVKSPGFFNESGVEPSNWWRGIEWYKSFFSFPNCISGEVSTGYTKYPRAPRVPEKIKAILPNVKLIYLVRNPVARYLSHYIHNVLRGEETRTLRNCLHIDSHYLFCSLYSVQIKQYLRYFDPSQLLIVSLERLYCSRHATLKEIFRFLQVDVSFWSPAFDMLHNTTKSQLRVNCCAVRDSKIERIGLHVANKLLESNDFLTLLSSNSLSAAMGTKFKDFAKLHQIMYGDFMQLKEICKIPLSRWDEIMQLAWQS